MTHLLTEDYKVPSSPQSREDPCQGQEVILYTVGTSGHPKAPEAVYSMLCHKEPEVPQMADTPAAQVCLNQPPFLSTGFNKVGEKWGVIFKCSTTRCVNLDLICDMDTDLFLLALIRFVAS